VRQPIGKKKQEKNDDDEFEIIGSTIATTSARAPSARTPRHHSTAAKTQRKHRSRVLVSSKIRKQGVNFKITHEYSDGTKDIEVINTDEDKPVRLVFQKQTEINSQKGWPGVKITKYFSDGTIEETKDWKHNKEWR
jgi:hypothetical protein